MPKMPLLTTLTALLLPLLTLHTPLTTAATIPRAGGPIAKPLPPNCHLDTTPTTFSPASTSFQTTQSANSTTVYYFFTSPAPQTTTADFEKTCSEQCYGFGNEGDCKAVFIAYDALTPVGYYHTAGGARATACLMFSRALTAADFELPVVEGTYRDAKGLNIVCDGPQQPPPPPPPTTTTTTPPPSEETFCTGRGPFEDED